MSTAEPDVAQAAGPGGAAVPAQRSGGWIHEARRVEKPWGHEVIFALVDGKFCGKTLNVKAGHALSLQYHEFKEEVISVQSGSVKLEVGTSPQSLETVTMHPGDTVHLRPGILHRVSALTDSVLLESSTTELTDVVRLEDHYGRAGTSDA